jgi:hypothetical protein
MTDSPHNFFSKTLLGLKKKIQAKNLRKVCRKLDFDKIIF